MMVILSFRKNDTPQLYVERQSRMSSLIDFVYWTLLEKKCEWDIDQDDPEVLQCAAAQAFRYAP